MRDSVVSGGPSRFDELRWKRQVDLDRLPAAVGPP
jgi:hypothetical protein